MTYARSISQLVNIPSSHFSSLGFGKRSMQGSYFEAISGVFPYPNLLKLHPRLMLFNRVIWFKCYMKNISQMTTFYWGISWMVRVFLLQDSLLGMYRARTIFKIKKNAVRGNVGGGRWLHSTIKLDRGLKRLWASNEPLNKRKFECL